MAFTSTLVKKERLPGGKVLETYTWDGSAVTTGSITANTTIQPEIVTIDDFGASSNGDTAVVCARDAGATVLKLTFTSGDAGTAFIIGPAA